MEQMIQEFQQALNGLFSHLQWTFILMYVFVLYGIANKKEFKWYNVLMKKNETLNLMKEWIAGFIVGLFFVFFTFIGPEGGNSEYISSLLRSYIIVLVFNSVISKKIEKIEGDNKDGSVNK